MICGYIVVLTGLSWLRALELQTATWDMGIYQQALWSGAHGRGFYEAADLETGGFGSFLQVHTAFLLYLVVPLYVAFPGELVLFVVQATVVGLAALPLAKLAQIYGGCPRWGLFAGGIYLCWAPILAANLFDFHAEAFLPLELFTFFLFWTKERYRLALGVSALAFLTFDIAPILTFFVGVYFLLPDGASVRAWVSDLRAQRGGPTTRRLASSVVRALRAPRVRASLFLLVASAAAYELLLIARQSWVAPLLGVGPYPAGASATGYVVGSTLSEVGLSLNNFEIGLSQKLMYWAIALALLGFVPLLAPRAWVLNLPWLAFTFLSANLNYVIPGFQYGFILACGLLPTFVLAFPRLRRIGAALGDRWAARARGSQRAERSRSPPPPARTRVPWGTLLLAVGVGALVAANLAASPLDPSLQNIGLGAAYNISYDVPAGYAGLSHLIALLPAGALLLASEDIFPLVANDEHAYSLQWTLNPTLWLPFNSTDPPPLALLSEAQDFAVPGWLTAELSNSSVYGVRATVPETGAGEVLLYETGYTGAVEVFSPN